ncbi:MAG: magnesium transporter [Acutalibacteraceae bacterium]|nr:magnesium transporter [Acutalibacteraceae bacterium]
MNEEILQLIEEKKYARLRELLSEMNPADIAQILTDVPERELPVIFRILPKELAAEVFVEMDTEMQQLLIEAFSDTELREVMDELFMDDTVDIIDEMPATVAKRILKQTDPRTRKMINQLLAYPDDSAGSIMTTEYIDLKKDMTVEQAFDKIRRIGLDTETIYTCYVTDSSRHLLGIVSVKDLLLNEKSCIIGDIMDENIIYANTLDDKEEVAGQFEKYDLMALPVVDKENRLVGIVTVDDAIDVIQEEATEDIEKMAAILPSDKTYFRTSVFSTFKARIPWLMLLMISATFTGAIISSFEAKLTVLPALIAFIPMLMDTGGNSGSQSSVTIIRSISLGDIQFKDIGRVVWKELRVALCCSVVLAAINFVKMWLVDYMILHTFDPGKQFAEIAVVCLTLFFTVIVAKLIGCVLPIIAKKIGFDPAVMASPFITTIVDAISLFIYFNIAIAVLKI